MTSLSGGFLRDDTGALVTVPVASAVAPVQMSGGFVRDATEALVLGSAAPLAFGGGFLRDAAELLVTVDAGSAVSPVAMSGGFMRDATGALVTVAEGSAAAPVGFAGGFLRDANDSLVMVSSSGVPVFVRAGGNANGGTASVSSITANVPAAGHAAGNTLFVAICSGGATIAAPSSVTDSKGNTYTVDNSEISSTGACVAHSHLSTALVNGDTVTATWAATTQIAGIDTAEFSGVSATPVDRVTAVAGAASTSFDAGTTTTLSQAVELALGVFVPQGATGGSTAGAGWTKLNDLTFGSAGSIRALVWEYQITSSTAPVDATLTVVTAHSYSGITTTYKGA